MLVLIYVTFIGLLHRYKATNCRLLHQLAHTLHRCPCILCQTLGIGSYIHILWIISVIAGVIDLSLH